MNLVVDDDLAVLEKGAEAIGAVEVLPRPVSPIGRMICACRAEDVAKSLRAEIQKSTLSDDLR
jgi:hypothetical protein